MNRRDFLRRGLAASAWLGLVAVGVVYESAYHRPRLFVVGSVPELRWALAQARDGDTVRLRPGTYMLDRTIELPAKAITIEGSGATLRRGEHVGFAITAPLPADGLRITNIRIIGPRATDGPSATSDEAGEGGE